MLTAEIKVNGSPVGFLYLRCLGERDGFRSYTAEYYQPEIKAIVRFHIDDHKPDDGAAVLVSNAMKIVAGSLSK